jgi:hypothetical protein
MGSAADLYRKLLLFREGRTVSAVRSKLILQGAIGDWEPVSPFPLGGGVPDRVDGNKGGGSGVS